MVQIYRNYIIWGNQIGIIFIHISMNDVLFDPAGVVIRTRTDFYIYVMPLASIERNVIKHPCEK